MTFSHHQINTDLVQSLIRKQFPQWADLPIKPVEKGGYDNFTFHLGEEMSVRLPRDEGHAPQVEKEARWLPLLRPHLSLPIPVPLAKGVPDENYPFHWSVNKWIDGDTARHDNISDLNEFAVDLARFLKELQSIDASNGPLGGDHNYFRGRPLTMYKFNQWTMDALDELAGAIDTEKCLAIWRRAQATEWTKPPVWIHGDINPGNLLVTDGKLSSVIDFGVMAVGDPAAELTMAWTFFDDESRKVFLQSAGFDTDTEDRARGWALWKALTTCVWEEDKESTAVREARKVIDILLKE
ncbi:aminoglycoside phosphotransferase family protein [Cohnella lubricantis]|uniref:Aminoglycoside phosphotransferase family protein n=1 Tax=Cohnella lubricantis TaxID=2163172 RepID=A0A841TI89_9BACL|nr:aminoglycoside phosphotransferase family protein [Cohnella lubricantis]MBB6678958.1 aminoglycoside phosphotransferase family protein [Cohnella lubricantis]MBP2118823.1 aminoglycoside phosphotransferase (APT) family kinase protein [Cohnella lubricantis]